MRQEGSWRRSIVRYHFRKENGHGPNAEASSGAIGAATLISADQARGTVVHGRDGDKLDRYTVAIDKCVLEGASAYGPDSAPLFDEAHGQRVTEYYRLSLQGV
ncbi:hypothetical protein [Sphingomonas sp. DT-204]|uniref:hypothetical protein n=1 Tax=Sphingomonas sp. DT-204 TaxID=3396166 RepID=UPI003F1CD3BA